MAAETKRLGLIELTGKHLLEGLSRMKAFLIDPAARTVTAYNFYGHQDDIAKAIECSDVHSIRVTSNETLYVDDNGLFNDEKLDHPWELVGYDSPLVGKALLLGCDAAGDIVPSNYERRQSLVEMVRRLRSQFR